MTLVGLAGKYIILLDKRRKEEKQNGIKYKEDESGQEKKKQT